MKTQLFTLVIGIVCFTSFNSTAAVNSASEKNSDNISIYNLSATIDAPEFDEELTIDAWMSNDNVWNYTAPNVVANEPVTIEEELQLEDWMTDPKVWNANKAKHPVYNPNAKEYQIIHTFRFKKIVEQPLAVKGWMLNDFIWRM